MKKLFVLFITIILCIGLFTGCDAAEVKSEAASTESMFVLIEEASSWSIVYHKDTKVMYAVSDARYNYGTFTLLVNADGTPMIWGEK